MDEVNEQLLAASASAASASASAASAAASAASAAATSSAAAAALPETDGAPLPLSRPPPQNRHHQVAGGNKDHGSDSATATTRRRTHIAIGSYITIPEREYKLLAETICKPYTGQFEEFTKEKRQNAV
jgi:hypothetical protein